MDSKERRYVHKLFVQYYGEPPKLSWYPHKTRQKTVENRIKRLVNKFKSFYLTTTSLDKGSEEEETWYVDSGNWAHKKDSNEYNILVGHIKNCLEFLGGRKPLWKKKRRNK